MDHCLDNGHPERAGDMSGTLDMLACVGSFRPTAIGRPHAFVHLHRRGPSPSAPRLLLRTAPRGRPNGSAAEIDPDRRLAASTADAVICRQCGREITAATESRVVNNAHVHTFANPEGIVFEIACYGDAWGCAYVGPASSEFTWFSGHVWRIAVCAGCHVHLGWRFASSDGRHFHGLITSRIIVKTA